MIDMDMSGLTVCLWMVVKMTGSSPHLVSLGATLQEVCWLVILQVADAGISSSAQQQPQDLLLVGVTMETSCHV